LPVSAPGGSPVEKIMIRIAACASWLAATSTGILPYTVLGVGEDTPVYEAGPVIAGFPAHVPKALSWCIALLIVARVVVRLVKDVLAPASRWIFRIITPDSTRRPQTNASESTVLLHGDAECTSTGFYVISTIVIPCAIFVLTTDVYFYHYFYAMCPFLFVLVAAFLLPWRRAPFALVIAQILLGVTFLSYIHRNGGTGHGEYGLSYARQEGR
jgi:hypothetical protein